MLVQIAGPSGVGKTDVTRELIKLDQYRVVNTYTTRNLREAETEKVSVCGEVFFKMQSNNEFFCVDEFFGNNYGISVSDIETAITTNDKCFILDRPVWKWETFKELSTIKIILLPESLDSLIARVNQCDRNERLPVIIDDFENNYKIFYQEENQDPSILIVVNQEFKIEETVAKVHSFICQHLISSRGRTPRPFARW